MPAWQACIMQAFPLSSSSHDSASCFRTPRTDMQGYQAGSGVRRSASASGGAALDPADLEAGAVVGK